MVYLKTLELPPYQVVLQTGYLMGYRMVCRMEYRLVLGPTKDGPICNQYLEVDLQTAIYLQTP
jgi:hypothetical protein